MKLHYDLDMDWEGDCFIVSVHEINLVISAKNQQEIDEKLKKAVDGWVAAFGLEDLERSVKIYEDTHREFIYE